MEPETENLIKKKLEHNWIQARMSIEVLAVNPETTKQALEAHTGKLEKENKTVVYSKKYLDIREIKNPMPGIEKGYSYVVNLEVLTENFETLMFLVLKYGPSSIEIIKPDNIRIPLGEAQAILNSIAELIHNYAARGVGGIVIKSG